MIGCNLVSAATGQFIYLVNEHIFPESDWSYLVGAGILFPDDTNYHTKIQTSQFN